MLLFSVALFFWFQGFGGSDLYLIPFLVFIIYSGCNSLNPFIGLRSISVRVPLNWIFIFYVGVSLIIILTFILKYYSLSWNVWDVGIHSNLLLNISQGKYYISYLNAHGIADHFQPSMAPIALLYKIFPHTNWLTLSKALAYLSCPYLFYKIDREVFPESTGKFGILIGLYWLLLYKPAVSGLYYEFQPSSLSLPFILISFIFLVRRSFLYFYIFVLFSSGFKEHVATTLFGFGLCYFINQKKHLHGTLMMAISCLLVASISLIIMPYFRDYQPAWSQPFGPYEDIQGKIFYLFKILGPLLFIPLFFWKNGLIALPAIAVNLASSSENMISTSFHYDDISSVLLIISVILSKKEILSIFSDFIDNRVFIFLGLILIFIKIPFSPIRELMKVIPSNETISKISQINLIDEKYKDYKVFYQTHLGPVSYNASAQPLIPKDGPCDYIQEDNSVIVFDDQNSFWLDSVDLCKKSLEKYKQDKEFDLNVYVK